MFKIMPQAVLQNMGQSSEDYLKAIYKLEADGGRVSTNQLADKVNVTPAAATKAVRVLSGKELVEHQPYHGVRLTERGRKAALDVIRAHRLLELFLHDVLGYTWDEVDVEAERLEHHISKRFIEALDRLLDYPRFDPHGAPIPTPDGRVETRDARPLNDCECHDHVTVIRVRDDSAEALQYLAELDIRPGCDIEIVEMQPFNGPLILGINAKHHAVGRELAGYIFVKTSARPAGQAPQATPAPRSHDL